jgi:DNA-binding CsgD family transcriptional regulator
MRRNSYISSLTENQVLSYILRSISEGKNEDEIAERFDGDKELVKNLGRHFEASSIYCYELFR